MKFISWNVNGLRAIAGKGFREFILESGADMVSLQEIKAQPEQLDESLLHIRDYIPYWHPAEKKGYSGVCIYTRIKPLSVLYGIGDNQIDKEGRVISLEFEDYYLINVYFPHSQWKLARLDFKMKFNEAFITFVKSLQEKKPVVIGGDFNVAHEEKDLANPTQNVHNPGFYIDERNWFSRLCEKGYVDTFRMFTQQGGHYTWWTFRSNARQRNVGWRIDYFIVSDALRENVIDSKILSKVMGSDHCPIELIMR